MLKRLEAKDRFVWPDSSTGVVALDVERLQWLLKGADIAALRHHPKRHYARVS
ncbi:IS66 family insertion sequence element accessory protein TnpB [Paraburkholderia pallida]|uniref:IS66 family insertion sequence element accessory protein TnpB n=1 Tax=Paraburkholderia pallida TaxID=2547399 RepID=UPI003AB4DDE2